MAESRTKRVSVMIFLIAVFVLLAIFTGSWIYKIYNEQTKYTTKTTLAAVECGKYYFRIDQDTVDYKDGILYFEVENMLGADITNLMVSSGAQTVKIDATIGSGGVYPVSVPITLTEAFKVYPEGCGEVNFKNITFVPRT